MTLTGRHGVHHPRRAERNAGTERGSALVDVTFLGVVLLVPVIYLVVTVARIQAATYAVAQAAREAARVVVTTPPGARPLDRANAAVALAFQDQGFAPDVGTDTSEGTDTGAAASALRVDCGGLDCLLPENTVTVTATLWVPLPLVPDVVARAVPTRLPVSATHRLVVDRFRSAP